MRGLDADGFRQPPREKAARLERRPVLHRCRIVPLCNHVRRYSSDHISTVGMAQEFVKLPGAHFSKELSFLPLDIPWARIGWLQTYWRSPPGEK